MPPSRAAQTPSVGTVLVSGGMLGGGGVQTHLTLLCRLLRNHGAGVTLVASGRNWPIELIEEVRSWGVEMRLPPAFLAKHRRLAGLFSAATTPIAARGEFVSMYSMGEGNMQLRLRKWVRGNPVYVYHEIVDANPPNSTQALCALKSDALAANSRVVADQYLSHWPNLRVRIIPFLTASAPMSPPAPRPPVGDRPLRLIFLGRIVKHKRPDQLVLRWKELVASAPLKPARLDVYGYGDEQLLAQMKSFIARENLGDQITLHGSYPTSQLDSIIGNADMVVLPSVLEGLPLVLVEGMQRGVPFVSCSAGGTAEFGVDNPDVRVTSTDWDDFVRGLNEMAAQLRRGDVDAVRLHHWAESRYGYDAAAKLWLEALLRPREFWGIAAKDQ